MMVWSGPRALALLGEPAGAGPVQPGEGTALGKPNISLPIPTWRLSRRWSQALLSDT